jgi:hypothetical protein
MQRDQPPVSRILTGAYVPFMERRVVGLYRRVLGHNADKPNMEAAVAETSATLHELMRLRMAAPRSERLQRGEAVPVTPAYELLYKCFTVDANLYGFGSVNVCSNSGDLDKAKFTPTWRAAKRGEEVSLSGFTLSKEGRYFLRVAEHRLRSKLQERYIDGLDHTPLLFSKVHLTQETAVHNASVRSK